MSKKSNTKIINNNIDRTIKDRYNTISIKSLYFIVDGFLYETDNKTVLRKEKLSDSLNLKELNNKLLTPPILKQIQAYHKDNFKIISILEENSTLIIKLESSSAIAKIQSVYSAIPENLLNLCNAKKELPKSFVMDKITETGIITKKTTTKYFFNIYDNFFICSKSLEIYILVDNKLYFIASQKNTKNNDLDIITEAFKKIPFANISNFLKNNYNLTVPQQEQKQETFNFLDFAVYYLIANFEQEKQEKEFDLELEKAFIKLKDESIFNTEKPSKNLLPVLYTAEQKTTVKTVQKPLQIESKKQALSLTCKTVYLLPLPKQAAEPAKVKEFNHFDNFTELYLDRVKEKKAYRKQKSVFAGVLNEIGKFSSVACLIFLFLNSFTMIQKSNVTFENLAKMETKQELKQETSKQPIKTMLNLSDNTQGGTSYHLINKTAKNGTSDGLKWISLIGLFGIVKRKEERVKKKKVYFDSEIQQSIRLGDQMVFTNGKAGKNFVAECKQIHHSPANGKWYYMFEQV